jgi:regulator of sigma E protease
MTLTLSTVLAFIVTLAVLIVIHEYGHYRVAVACGVKVLRFSIGFGRVLWRRQPRPDGTEFVISALPLGGYVRMLDEREGPVAPQERAQAFNNRPLWQRAAIVAAGPIANLLLAIVFFAAAHWVGVQELAPVLASPPAGSLAQEAGLKAGDHVLSLESVAPESIGAEPEWRDVRSMTDLRMAIVQGALRGERLRLMVRDREGHAARMVTLDLDKLQARDVDEAMFDRAGVGVAYTDVVLGPVGPGPGADAGLRQGDRVLQIDGKPVDDAVDFLKRIREGVQPDGSAPRRTLVVDRAGRRLELVVQPRVDVVEQRKIARIAVPLVQDAALVTVRDGLIEGLVDGARNTWDTSALTLRMLGRMLIGKASLKNLSGPGTIADLARRSMERGLGEYLGLLAAVSVSLGVLNLLPLPVLDGGQLMYYIFEALTGRPVAGAWLRWLQGSGFVILLLLMSLALSNDVARFLGLH